MTTGNAKIKDYSDTPFAKHGKLTVDGNVDVTGTALSFTGGKPATGVFLTTTGLLTGPFAEVTGTEKDIRYTANSARFPSGLLLFLR